MKKIFYLTSDDFRAMAIDAIRTSNEGEVVTIQSRNRTTEQNSLYWVLLQNLSEQYVDEGKTFSSDTWHEYFKQQYLPKDYVELPDGNVKEKERTTTKLNKAEFSEYIEKVQAFCAQLGIEEYTI
jgi:hypothetical protein